MTDFDLRVYVIHLSTPQVLIVIISDIEEMEGGLLRVLQQPDSSGRYFQEIQAQGVPPELVETVRYTGPGFGIFMQVSLGGRRVVPFVMERQTKTFGASLSTFSPLFSGLKNPPRSDACPEGARAALQPRELVHDHKCVPARPDQIPHLQKRGFRRPHGRSSARVREA